MAAIVISWKTTLAGLAAILGALTDVAAFAAQGHVTPHIEADFAAISAGIGLIFARDHGK